MLRISLVVLILLAAAPVMAQSPYVAGSIGADISRFSHSESDLVPLPTDDSEVVSGSLRVGTAIGSNWGVDLEFERGGRSRSSGPAFIPLLQTGLPPSAILGTIATAISAIPIPIDSRSETRPRRSNPQATAWARQEVSNSVDLVYLAGIAFSRERSDTTDTVIPGPRLPPQTFRNTLIRYGTHPVVGVEARIGLTSKLRLIPGFRLQGL